MGIDRRAAQCGRARVLAHCGARSQRLGEPTTGLDPAARRETWTMIEAFEGSGVTIVLTTDDRDEGHALADRLVILGLGVVSAQRTFSELATRVGRSLAQC